MVDGRDKDDKTAPRPRPDRLKNPPDTVGILCGDLQTETIDVGSLTSTGTDLSSFGPFPGAILFLGEYTGLQWSMRGGQAQWIPAGRTPVFYNGQDPIYIRRRGFGGGEAVATFVPWDGVTPIRRWLYDLGVFWFGSPGGPGFTGAVQPNRSDSFSDVLPAGVKSSNWTIPGFVYATVLNPVGNAGTIFIGGTAVTATFPLVVGAAENFYVAASFGFFYDGTAGDTINWIEYGRS